MDLSYYEIHKEKMKQYQTNYNKANKQHIKIYQRNYYLLRKQKYLNNKTTFKPIQILDEKLTIEF